MAIQGKTDIDQLLAKSLKEIAVRRPVEKITIKEITDKAGVIRPTFYNHFQDKFELIEWIIRTELLEPVEPLIRNDMIIEAMVLLFTNIEKDKAFYSQLVKMEGPVKFHDIAKKCVREVLLELIQNESMADAGGDIFLLCTVHVFCNRGMDQHGNDHLAARNGRSISVYADPVSDRHHQRIIKRICDDILNDLYTNSYKSLKMYNHAVHDEKIEYFHIRSFFL